MTITLSPIAARQALTQNGAGKLAINPYQGCVFACEFCSAIKMNYFTGRVAEKWDKTGWGTWLDYKTNLIELLHTERAKIRRSKIHFGNATDIYMPIERRLKLVPPIIEFFIENPPLELEVQTRGASRDIVRDIPALRELAKRTSVLVSYSIHTDRDDVKRIFEPKAPSLVEREKGLRLYHEAGLRTRLSCMPLLPLDPENYARRFAPYVTNHVWVAPMYHRQLTASLFLRHFPEWTRAEFLDARMRELQSAFESRGVRCYIRPSDEDKTAARERRRHYRRRELQQAREHVTGAQIGFAFE